MVEVRLSSSERFRQKHSISFPEVTISQAGVEGAQTLHTVPALKKCRVIELTINHLGTKNTNIQLLVGENVKLTVPIPPQTARVWGSQLGRVFVAEEVVKVQSSDVEGGNTTVSGSGLEEAV